MRVSWPRPRRLGALAVAVALAACSQDVSPTDVRNLDRPSDLAFACFGDHLLADGETIVNGVIPLSECAAASTTSGPKVYGFIAQSGAGTLAMAELTTGAVLDTDPLTPGRNGIPVGSLPVGVEQTPAGCHVMTANAGTCDLAIVDVTRAIGKEPAVARQEIVTAGGEPFLARPRAIAAQPAPPPVCADADCTTHVVPDEPCAGEPTGLLYVAYPACGLVAAVDVATGAIRGGVAFADDGTSRVVAAAEIENGAGCPIECGADAPDEPTAGGVVDAGPAGPDAASAPADAGAAAGGDIDAGPLPSHGVPGPSVLLWDAFGNDLYIGATNSAALTMVTLGADNLPVSTRQIRLEGDIGLSALAVTGDVEMGGDGGRPGGSAGTYRFAYAIASDETVRVVDLGGRVECDTQVDPRYLHEERSASRLACLPVGAPDTPPRRLSARSPGIQLPRGATPLSVSLFTLSEPVESDTPAPLLMVGTFALVSASDGRGYLVNIDDDNYRDFEDPEDPAITELPLAMAHQLRDAVTDRAAPPDSCSVVSTDTRLGASRMLGVPSRGVNDSNFDTAKFPSFVSLAKVNLLPRLRGVLCQIIESVDDDMDPNTPEVNQVKEAAAVSELSAGAPIATRELAYPDLESVRNERWSLVWEGRLSFDSGFVDVDGLAIRNGSVRRDGKLLAIDDGGAPFCRLGAEPFDIARLAGCSSDLQCGVGETCFFHPDQPAVIDAGLCLPTDRALSLGQACRDLLISRRRFTVRETYADHLVLGERRRVLRTTPLDGCVSDDECADLAVAEAELTDDLPPGQIATPPTVAHRFRCDADPTRAPGPPECMMTCDAANPCEDGTICSSGFCVEGAVPPAECLAAVQRYDVSAGDAFAVIGRNDQAPSGTGFVHHRIVDPQSGECVTDPDGSPLAVSRIPLRGLPECGPDSLDEVSPNPCRTTIDDTHNEPADVCMPGDTAPVTTTVPAVRFRNSAFTIHLVDVATDDDLMCVDDGQGGRRPFSPVFPGFSIAFTLGAGFSPLGIPLNATHPANLRTGPDGLIWVLDDGDAQVGTVTRGRVIRFVPSDAVDAFGLTQPPLCPPPVCIL